MGRPTLTARLDRQARAHLPDSSNPRHHYERAVYGDAMPELALEGEDLVASRATAGLEPREMARQ